jgi:Raf kinase inhibitor-like YbhB/YbcL family protein
MQPNSESTSLIVTSPAFGTNDMIPIQFTADGDNIAPPLEWTPPPHDTRSIAIVVEDPDAPRGTFIHWVAYGIPAEVTEIPAGGELPEGAMHGTNDYGEVGWSGPNPPNGLHRYFFKLYAVDNYPHRPGMTKAELMATIKGHVLARGEMIGTYDKNAWNRKRTSNEAPVKRVTGHR